MVLVLLDGRGHSLAHPLISTGFSTSAGGPATRLDAMFRPGLRTPGPLQNKSGLEPWPLDAGSDRILTIIQASISEKTNPGMVFSKKRNNLATFVF